MPPTLKISGDKLPPPEATPKLAAPERVVNSEFQAILLFNSPYTGFPVPCVSKHWFFSQPDSLIFLREENFIRVTCEGVRLFDMLQKQQARRRIERERERVGNRGNYTGSW